MIGNEDGTDDWLTLKFNAETPYSFDHSFPPPLHLFLSTQSPDPPERQYQQCNDFKCLQFKQDHKKTMSKNWIIYLSNFLWVTKEKGMKENKWKGEATELPWMMVFAESIPRYHYNGAFVGRAAPQRLPPVPPG